MSVVLSEDRRGAAHYIVSEAANIYRSREQVLIASGAGKLPAGMVLGKVTASKKFVPLAPCASDGSQTAAAILFEACDATSADVRRTITARDTEVQVDVLQWPAGVNDTQKNAALAALAALGIIGR